MSILHLIGLTCHRTQEARDEAMLRVNDRRVWGPRSMNDGQSRNLTDEKVSFSLTAHIDLWERDRGPSRDDFLGSTVALSAMENTGEKRVTLGGGRALYTLTYEVLPDSN